MVGLILSSTVIVPSTLFIYPFPPTTTGFQAQQEIFLHPFLASLKTASGL
jgi:hypothetical protein